MKDMRKVRIARSVKRGATATRRQRRAVAGGRITRFGWISGQRSERIARLALASNPICTPTIRLNVERAIERGVSS